MAEKLDIHGCGRAQKTVRQFASQHIKAKRLFRHYHGAALFRLTVCLGAFFRVQGPHHVLSYGNGLVFSG